MRPLDFYELGRQMAGSAQTEAEQRTVVNRLYYGLHHEACGRYFQKEVRPQPINRNRRHRGVLDRFNRSIDPIGGNVARLLGELMRLRGVADYQLPSKITRMRNIENTEQLMRRSIGVSEQLKSALDRYSPRETPDGFEYPEAYSTG